jgi:hypothetical protein
MEFANPLDFRQYLDGLAHGSKLKALPHGGSGEQSWGGYSSPSVQLQYHISGHSLTLKLTPAATVAGFMEMAKHALGHDAPPDTANLPRNAKLDWDVPSSHWHTPVAVAWLDLAANASVDNETLAQRCVTALVAAK